MHASVIHVEISDLSEAKQGLDEVVLPMMRQAPGFVGATFVASDGSHGVSIGVFETEEQARLLRLPSGPRLPASRCSASSLAK